MERSKDRLRNGYRDYDPRVRREELDSERYQTSFEGEDVYNDIMQAGRNRNNQYRDSYDDPNYRRQNYDQGFDGYNEYDEGLSKMDRNQRDTRYEQMAPDTYHQTNMNVKRASYPYDNTFSNEPIDSLIDYDYQQSMPNRSNFDEPNQYQSGQQYNQMDSSNMRRMEHTTDSYINTDAHTQPFTFVDTPSPRQRIRKDANLHNPDTAIQNTQGMAIPNARRNNEVIRPARKTSLTLSEEYEMNRKQKKKKEKIPKERKEKKQPIKREHSENQRTNDFYTQFAKWNFLIFVVAFINIVFITLITSSLIYSEYFKNFALQNEIVQNIITYCLIISLLFAYNTAGLHCGFTILRQKLSTMNIVVKILLFPVLLLVIEVIGFLCEIPYLLYSFIKAGDK